MTVLELTQSEAAQKCTNHGIQVYFSFATGPNDSKEYHIGDNSKQSEYNCGDARTYWNAIGHQNLY